MTKLRIMYIEEEEVIERVTDDFDSIPEAVEWLAAEGITDYEVALGVVKGSEHGESNLQEVR